MEDIEKILSEIDGGDVLDVATGRGNFIKTISDFRSFNSITTIDISEKSEGYIEENYADMEITWMEMDASGMKFLDETFDTVCISNSLHHMENPDKVLSEMIRVLKKGGRFIMLEMYSDNQDEPARMTHVLIHEWWGEIDRLMDIHHYNTFKRNELLEKLYGLGFSDIFIKEVKPSVENVMDEETIEKFKGHIEMYFDKARDLDNSENLIEKGEMLKKRLDSVGIASSASIFAVGIK